MRENKLQQKGKAFYTVIFIKSIIYVSILKMKQFVISVIPSEDVTLKILSLRTALFRKFGLISARALPVMIPAGYSSNKINKNIFSEITLKRFICSKTCTQTAGGDIYLCSEDPSFTETIGNLIPDTHIPPVFDILPGFYLCTVRKKQVLPEIITYIDSQIDQSIGWKKSSLQEIEIVTDRENWWESLKWETLWNIKIE